ncbi:MAG: HAD family phosphatase [Longicatena sp.]
MIRGYILDLDGTVLDSMNVWEDVAQRYLASKGIQAKANLTKVLAPMSLNQSSKYLKKEYGLSESSTQIIKEINATIAKQYKEELPLKYGVKEFIERCCEQHIKIAILTASNIELTSAALKRCGIYEQFSFIMTCEEMKMDKTNPNIYEAALKKLALEKEDCIFIEDSYHAIACLKSIGCRCIAVYDKANEKNWIKIKQCSDVSVLDLSKWEVS